MKPCIKTPPIQFATKYIDTATSPTVRGPKRCTTAKSSNVHPWAASSRHCCSLARAISSYASYSKSVTARPALLVDRTIIDLISANVNDHGIVFPEKLLSEILTEAVKHAVEYKPDSLGQSVAREAISTYTDVPAKHILLTPGTSLSYWYAFKLLCEPGSEVLCPTPSYPLLNYITRLAEIELNTYKLNEQKHWSVDMDQIEQQISEQTRAIVLISPHNPTGMVSSQSQINELCRIAAKHNLPLIFDEVFRRFV